MSTIDVKYACLCLSGWGYSSKYIILFFLFVFLSILVVLGRSSGDLQTSIWLELCILYTKKKQLFTSSYIPTLSYTCSMTVFKTVAKNVLDRQILYVTVANCLQYENEYTFFKKTRTKLAATGGHWRLLTSPIVEKKCDSLIQISNSREK